MSIESARILLDVPAMAQLFGGVPALRGCRVEGSELVALWVKPGRHFNACYELRIAGAKSAKLRASGFALDHALARRLASDSGPHIAAANPSACPHCCTTLARPGLLLQLFPFDYRLSTLPACLNLARVNRAVDIALRVTDCEPVGYRPGMRCQIRYKASSGTCVYGKVAVEESPGERSRLHRRVHAALIHAPHRFRVPQPLRYIRELRLAIAAEASGESLYDALRMGRELSVEVRTIAEALADFHGLDIDSGERVYAIHGELDLLHHWVKLLAALCPKLAAALTESETELTRTQPEPVAARAFVHRDFYDKQVLLSGGAVVLLDMDTCCRGDPEIDLGNFCAHLRLRGLQWDLQRQCSALEEIFLRSYPRPVAGERVAWYRRSALLRLACGYALRPRWRHLAPFLLAEVGPP